jgi:hypothetical protein
MISQLWNTGLGSRWWGSAHVGWDVEAAIASAESARPRRSPAAGPSGSEAGDGWEKGRDARAAGFLVPDGPERPDLDCRGRPHRRRPATQRPWRSCPVPVTGDLDCRPRRRSPYWSPPSGPTRQAPSPRSRTPRSNLPTRNERRAARWGQNPAASRSPGGWCQSAHGHNPSAARVRAAGHQPTGGVGPLRRRGRPAEPAGR